MLEILKMGENVIRIKFRFKQVLGKVEPDFPFKKRETSLNKKEKSYLQGLTGQNFKITA